MCDDLNRDIMPACNVTGERMAMGNHYYERLDSCPLIELPPHGDLIDRNKLYEKTADWEAQALHMVEVTMHDEDTTEWRKWSTVLRERSAFKFDVADAPVIIPTERGEE
jgi:hypothetical protein